ncbi:MAG: hypothetical protein FJ225_12455 [Lentisphaerae bacterium]|nr:hypothetical protein [Lentisphaerota bacterium]
MNTRQMESFRNPGNEYRGAPFWAWNGRLETEELRRQVRVMRRMGLGGFFMHSRVGLDTPYLSKEWFDCVNACVDEAKKLKMNAWLYDEDRWPSGAAGGLVTRNQKYRMRSVKVAIRDSVKGFKWTAGTIGAFVARLDGATAREVRPVARGKRPAPLAEGEKLVVFVVELQGCSNWYNGYTYLDTLSHEAVREFIEVTHEAYRRHCGKEFGEAVPGMFTDEPNHGNVLGHDNNTGEPGGLPWTGSLPATFRKRYGYDLLPHLMELAFDVDGNGMRPARYHYHDCVTHLYADAFNRQIGEWCARNGMLFTGHQLYEDDLRGQTSMIGSCMRTYEHMQAPGMDLLTEHWRAFNTAKQVSSAARQFGAKWRLTETYGCTGWDFPFAGHKALGDWQAALGINFRCQHLAWYTMSGEAKRDYPAGIFYQSPWWELYGKVEDYFARVHAAMTIGEEVRDLLVIHPVESMWMLVRAGWESDPGVNAYNNMFSRFSAHLLADHLDFDFGDEEILSRRARISGTGREPLLRVAKATYKAVLVPPMKTMRRSTLELLKKFKTSGGVVSFVGEIASAIEGVPSDEVKAFAATCPRTPEPGPAMCAPLGAARRLSIAGPDGREIGPVLYLLREDKDAFYLFVCNTGEDFVNTTHDQWNQPMARDRKLAFGDVRIRGFAGCKGAPRELNPDTGGIAAADAARSRDGWEIRTSLPALGSRLFVVPKKAGTAVAPRPAALRTIRSEPLADELWAITLSECSNLVLDRPRYRIGGRPWQPETEILRVDKAVRDALGVPHRGGSMVQPWARKPPAGPKRTTVTLAYAFECRALPSGDLFLALEEPQTFRVSLNGNPVTNTAECGWWVDRSLRKLPLDPAVLKLGANELVLECDYPETHRGLEIIYLLGNFGTAAAGTAVAVTAPPASLKIGDWCAQGLAFYSGSVAYRRTLDVRPAAGERVFVRVPDYRGAAVRVLVNGQTAGIIGWEPNEVEITGLLTGAPVELAIEVVGHRRNSHGPFHINVKWPAWTGPGEFARQGDGWMEGYQLVPCGLMAAPVAEVRRQA